VNIQNPITKSQSLKISLLISSQLQERLLFSLVPGQGPQRASTESGYLVAESPHGFCVTGDDAFGRENPAESWEAKSSVLGRC